MQYMQQWIYFKLIEPLHNITIATKITANLTTKNSITKKSTATATTATATTATTNITTTVNYYPSFPIRNY